MADLDRDGLVTLADFRNIVMAQKARVAENAITSGNATSSVGASSTNALGSEAKSGI